MRRAGSGRRGQQQVAEVGGEHPNGLVLGPLPQPHPQVDPEVDQDAGAPRPAHGLGQPPVGRAARVGDAEPAGDGLLVRRRRPRHRHVRRLVLGVHGQVEDLFLLAAERGEDAVRRQPGERLGEVEVVGELRARLLLAVAHPGDEPPRRPHPLPQFADQVGVFGEALHQDGAGPVQGGLRVGDAPVRVDVGRRLLLRVAGGPGQQQLGQRLQAGFAGDLRLGPALRLVGQVDVLQAGLGVGGHDLPLERVVELALRPDRLQDRGPPLVQLAQVAEPFLQRAELRVVQRPGHFLAVAGDERHRGPAVEQLDRGGDLALPHAELIGDPRLTGCGPGRRAGTAARRVPGREPAAGHVGGRLDRFVGGRRHDGYPLSAFGGLGTRRVSARRRVASGRSRHAQALCRAGGAFARRDRRGDRSAGTAAGAGATGSCGRRTGAARSAGHVAAGRGHSGRLFSKLVTFT